MSYIENNHKRSLGVFPTRDAHGQDVIKCVLQTKVCHIISDALSHLLFVSRLVPDAEALSNDLNTDELRSDARLHLFCPSSGFRIARRDATN